ncbi:hypothetical protein ACJMK2_015177, partial [Sinanodonta woodiana]
HKASGVLVMDEIKRPVIEGLAKQIAQEHVDVGQSTAETATPSSGPSSKDTEDEKQ